MFTSIAYVTWVIILVILGFNALIIVHEFGHFIVARWCGVRCDKFYIWFDAFGLRLFRFKWGQTEYGMGWVPLGGYVKMFGQEDNPGEVRAEIERAKKVAEGDGAEQSVEEVKKYEKTMYSADSYLSKSVPQRIAIISAGVIMNFIFAFICAAGAYWVGLEETAPEIGAVVPGSPAWRACLSVGDTVEEINGKKTRVFSNLQSQVISASSVKLRVKRDMLDGATVDMEIPTWIAPAAMNQSLGVVSSRLLKTVPLKEYPKEIADPNDKNYLPVFPPELLDVLRTFTKDGKAGDGSGMIISVNGKPVNTYSELQHSLQDYIDKPAELELRQYVDMSKYDSGEILLPESKTVTLPPLPVKRLDGVRFKMGEIVTMIIGSDIGQHAVAGDVIVAVDGDREFDPLRLPYLMRKKINDGETTAEVTIWKAETKQEDTFKVELTRHIVEPELMSPNDYISCTPLGVSYRVDCVVDANGGEGKVSEVVFLDVKNPGEMPFVSRDVSFSQVRDGRLAYSPVGKGERIALPVLMLGVLQNPRVTAGMKVQLTVDGIPSVHTVVTADDWFAPKRLPQLEPVMVTSKYSGLHAIAAGFDKTVDSTLFIFKVLQGFVTQKVSVRGMGGPILIVQQAYKMADNGIATFLFFLCLIGANLAVLNILPIPILDGGHLAFLIYEGITGREPNAKVFEILCWLGLILLLSLMAWVTLLDVSIIQRN
ncbi:MAG: site-2 protease family protein [Planctomycetaceae bacterium]|jgi:regulator of sigma E protease|nr:site-2 protease family protein [Planctomycetaceae bacterium]